MFFRINTPTFPLAYTPVCAPSQSQRIFQCLAVALKHSICDFQRRKTQAEKAVARASQVSLPSSLVLKQHKSQKTQISLQAISDIQKQSVKNSKYSGNKSYEINPQQKQEEIKTKTFYPKRKIIRKIKTYPPLQQFKQINKNLKLVKSKEQYLSLTAIIPRLSKIPQREICRKIQQFKKRSISQWNLTDALTQRKKRFLKHLQ